MRKVFTAPDYILNTERKGIFLAGTIEMGKSVDWQQIAIYKLSGLDYDIYNPRRTNFDNVNSDEQVNWEIDAMEKSKYIFMNILPDSKSPITLLEFGMHYKSGKLIVCCPKQFYRSENIHIMCERFSIPLFIDFDKAIEYTQKKLHKEQD